MFRPGEGPSVSWVTIANSAGTHALLPAKPLMALIAAGIFGSGVSQTLLDYLDDVGDWRCPDAALSSGEILPPFFVPPNNQVGRAQKRPWTSSSVTLSFSADALTGRCPIHFARPDGEVGLTIRRFVTAT